MTTRMQELLDQIKELEAQLEPLREEWRELSRQQVQNTEERVQAAHRLQDKFDPTELRYAAYDRCECGAGLAYPLTSGMHGAWHCSAILTGTADTTVPHTGGKPFSMWEIKSEDQPSANGATTRPQ